ncbi:MAG: GIY-YIG nuclease family protein [Acidobacteriota bacterium]
MRIGLNLKPGKGGTKRLLAQYGERLVCVRYRYDEKREKRFKTVEIIVEESDWDPCASVPGYVYFVKSENGKVKIGKTANLEERVRTLKRQIPFALSLEHSFKTRDMKAVERMFHEKFAENRLEGEWFDLPDEILESLKRGDYNKIVKEAESHSV